MTNNLSHSALTEEDKALILEFREVINKISNTINRLPQRIKDHLENEVNNFNKESKCLDDAIISFSNK
jgi:hypothetical protein